jgi:hypothetical protein
LEPRGQQQQQLNCSDSTLTAPSNKQTLLRCCFSASAAQQTAEGGEENSSGQQQQQQRRRSPQRQSGRQRKRATIVSREEEEEETAGGQQQRVKQQRVKETRSRNGDDELLSGISLHTLMLRSQHDLFSAILRSMLLFGVHCTSAFQSGQPHLERVLAVLCILVGAISHHVYPQLRAKYPWKLFAQPFLRPFEFHQFETTVEAKLTVFERVHVWMLSLEKNIVSWGLGPNNQSL